MELLDGKIVSDFVKKKLKEKIIKEKINATLAIILVGTNQASEIYVSAKIKAFSELGMKAILYRLDETINELEVIKLISKLNKDNNIHGILLQSPLPKHLDFNKCASKIEYFKDVDGLGSENVYKNYMNESGILPCTVKGILELLKYYEIDITHKDVVIVGKGNLVGKPLAIAMQNKGATVTVCHSKTKNLKEKCSAADILISATGQKELIKKDFVKENAVVIDVGITRSVGKLSGDVDFESVKDKCSFITPVPGGVGPMTVAMVLSNTIEAYERINNG